MNYERRLKAAAKVILDADAAAGNTHLNFSDIGVTATLKPHQVEGVSWLIRRYLLGVNVLLGDEMGLGKTLQAISLLSYLKHHQKPPSPFLVLCPLSVTDGWVAEIRRFAPKLKVLRYVGDKEQRRHLRRQMYEHVKEHSSLADVSVLSSEANAIVSSLPFDILLTTYDVALIDQDFLSQIPWYYAIIDEAQRLKNPSSVLYQVLSDRFIMPRRLLMTGTPVQNNLTELWSLMHFCMPSVFCTLEEFLIAFREAGDTKSDVDTTTAKNQFNVLKSILKAFMLRRTKTKLIESGNLVLPPLTEVTLMAPLVSLQKKVYTSILRKELPKLLALSTSSSHQSLQNIVIQLRKACSHPYLFPGIEPEPYEEGEHLVQASGKLMILDKLLQKLYDSGHRVLLFAQMTHTLDILQDFLELRKYSYDRLDGSVRAEERFAAIRNFSGQSGRSISVSERDGPFVFMISTRAGGVGLNLVAADTVIMRRAERKLQLSHNVIGDATMREEGKEAGEETGDLRSIIMGLHVFDPLEMNIESPDGVEMVELNSMVDRVLGMRHGKRFRKDDRKFELSLTDLKSGLDFVEGSSASYDPVLDEASYFSWVENFKEASQLSKNTVSDLVNRRNLPDDRHIKLEDARKKAEVKKLAKWEALGYNSLAIKDPIHTMDSDLLSNLGSVNFVVGDCTHPEKFCQSKASIIFSCVDDSGNWGHGGMFDALARLSSRIPDAYQRASEAGDLHLGDVHLIKVTEDGNGEIARSVTPQWAALAVVQSYNARRKVPRSSVSVPELEHCLSKVSFAAYEKSASIHMPRIGYQDGSDRSLWYAVERFLRKYASIYGIDIYVYYYRRST